MGLAQGILGFIGGGLDRSIRTQFNQIARMLFASAPIETVKNLFGLYGRGQSFEEEQICCDAFEAAKLGGPGSLRDQNARVLAVRYADYFSKNGPIEAVVLYLDMFERIYNNNIYVTPSNVQEILEESIAKIETSDDGRFVYVRNKLTESMNA